MRASIVLALLAIVPASSQAQDARARLQEAPAPAIGSGQPAIIRNETPDALAQLSNFSSLSLAQIHEIYRSSTTDRETLRRILSEFDTVIYRIRTSTGRVEIVPPGGRLTSRSTVLSSLREAEALLRDLQRMSDGLDRSLRLSDPSAARLLERVNRFDGGFPTRIYENQRGASLGFQIRSATERQANIGWLEIMEDSLSEYSRFLSDYGARSGTLRIVTSTINAEMARFVGEARAQHVIYTTELARELIALPQMPSFFWHLISSDGSTAVDLSGQPDERSNVTRDPRQLTIHGAIRAAEINLNYSQELNRIISTWSAGSQNYDQKISELTRNTRTNLADLEHRITRYTHPIFQRMDDQHTGAQIEINQREERGRFASNAFYAMLATFALVLIGMFIIIKFFDDNSRQWILRTQSILQIFTVFVLVSGIIVLTLAGKLEGQVLSTLLAGISGYVLGNLKVEGGRGDPQPSGGPKPADRPGTGGATA